MATLGERECPLHRDGHPTSRSLETHISKIGGLTDSDSEYSSDLEDELNDLIQYSKEVESNSTRNPKSDQDYLPNLVIYATPQGRTVRWKDIEDP